MFLELKNLNIGYKTPLVNNTNAGLELGDVCLLIGNNGVGKTTLIKTILNQIPTLSGSIALQGKNIAHCSAQDIAEQIAVVFSKATIPLGYTVEDLIALGKYIHYPYYFELNSEDKAEVTDLISQLNLSQYRHFPLQKLSDGNLQKAFIGRAFAQHSPLIILDEPTTHLDEDNKVMILKLLRDFAKKHHKIILFSSHDWRLAKTFADKIWFIKGQKLYSGIAEDVLAAHEELSHPLYFNDGDFQPPYIIAPDLQRELLLEFLQKHFQNNLSSFAFEWHSSQWHLNFENKTHQAKNFEEILWWLKEKLEVRS
ncbi:ABC transporter [Bergeyella porcorum]|uniref:ABC transporter n=1 Tax=Bergeyella porcorum TaxID=1735111 RepID=A0AAU0F4J2_9FLAO